MAKQTQSKAKNQDIIYIFAYLLTWLSGIIVFLIAQNDSRKKFHGLQALFLGVIAIILWFIPFVGIIDILIWLYGMYIGIMAYGGKDVMVPVLGDFAKQYSK